MATPTNPYYQRAFNALAGTLARARQMVNEFALVQRGFDLIKDRIAALEASVKAEEARLAEATTAASAAEKARQAAEDALAAIKAKLG